MSFHFFLVHLYFFLGIMIAFLFLMYCSRTPYVNIMCFNQSHLLLPPSTFSCIFPTTTVSSQPHVLSLKQPESSCTTCICMGVVYLLEHEQPNRDASEEN